MTPAAQRKAKERALRRQRGEVLFTVWIKPEQREAVKAAVAKVLEGDDDDV